MFGPNSVNVARYASLIGTKSPTKCDAQLTESNFQTRSSKFPFQYPVSQLTCSVPQTFQSLPGYCLPVPDGQPRPPVL
ncbi:DUF6783 domain-containing protein [Enterocloster hominis (ex Hitch et al. 2024)]|uniref:DUF6783 domain-containing protein n=1 Tax=Enterocloster hominis (ex Hitch et al. 2024) TaxID=1917870 RepID=UPI002E2FF7D3|nr:DUF6783 domain-containing protein [Lachnoclostridium pacaense]